MAAPGTDIAFNESRTEGYRNFANKIWNAARFMFMNQSALVSRQSPASGAVGFEARTLEDRWILSRFNRTAQAVGEELSAYRFHEAASHIYDFFWTEFCDWYLELLKPRLASTNDGEVRIARGNLASLFEAALRLLHPIMPFITEEIWQTLYDGKPPCKSIALAYYPQPDETQIELSSETEMAILQDLIVSVRNLRSELKVEQKLKIPIEVYAHDADTRRLIEENRGAVERLANVERITFVDESLAKKPGARSTARFDVHVLYKRKIDVEAERKRLQKELEQIEKEIAGKERQLGNQQFVAKAPAKVVEDMRKRLEELTVLRDKLKRQLEELG
jgi:valyl-tRNA synthetase